jgi:hypothetical protein
MNSRSLIRKVDWLFRPSYGEIAHVTPKHWWSPKERRLARISASVLDYEWRMQGVVARKWISIEEAERNT